MYWCGLFIGQSKFLTFEQGFKYINSENMDTQKLQDMPVNWSNLQEFETKTFYSTRN
jgi:hypothetical protein